ncbi:hypothetical protein [Psychrobacter sp. 4Dc]
MLIKAASDYPSNWSAIQAIETKTGCTPEALRSWRGINNISNKPLLHQ